MKKYLKAYTVFNRDPIFIYYDFAVIQKNCSNYGNLAETTVTMVIFYKHYNKSRPTRKWNPALSSSPGGKSQKINSADVA